jgi:PHD/YefM family antitoxin component YafN of YafNO toxin-antitoxin module
MNTFSSLDMQQRTGEVQSAALREPIALTFHGRPRNVMMSVEEFARLKIAAGEPVPAGLQRRAVTQRGLPDDPLGYETGGDFRVYAMAMAEAALSGRNKSAVRKEISAVEKRLGLKG